MLKGVKKNRKYPHDPDLIAHIIWLWLVLPCVQHQIRWVKSHQDLQQPYDELPRNAQLNVLADKLATEFANGKLTQKCPPWNNPMFFPQSRVTVIINGQRATAYP
jgi:hypothetical protein